jgi:nicotinamidase-related amidase
MPHPTPHPLLLVDLQHGFLNDFTRHIPERVVRLLERDRTHYDPVLVTRFINIEGGPFRRFLDWHGCATSPETDLVPEIMPWVEEEHVFSKPGSAGMSPELVSWLQEHAVERVTLAGIDTDMCVLKIALDIFDLGIEPIILVDCCASTAGLQSHLAGLAVLARNIGADKLHDAGLGGGTLAAPLAHPVHTAIAGDETR